MSAAKKLAPPPEPAREFEKLLRSLDRHNTWQTFGDFAELSAIAFANVVEKRPEREQRHTEILKRYTPAEVQVFPQLLACAVNGLEQGDSATDFLGDTFMALELANHWRGQFFTSISLCTLMGQMTFDETAEQLVRERGFINCQDPAVGAGAMVIGLAVAMRDKGYNPQTQLHVTAIDVDSTAAHMAFVQFALLGLPAVVCVGDTLAGNYGQPGWARDVLRTPWHHLGFWDARLRVDAQGPETGSGESDGAKPYSDTPNEPGSATGGNPADQRGNRQMVTGVVQPESATGATVGAVHGPDGLVTSPPPESSPPRAGQLRLF